ncbi:MAG TPA: hypothetical protein ENI86_15345, partial [Acidimicrobiales bacterium]|nr:hypothetical protein [Acidimicrobiales bacterium]
GHELLLPDGPRLRGEGPHRRRPRGSPRRCPPGRGAGAAYDRRPGPGPRAGDLRRHSHRSGSGGRA